jgi:hypothetical protein
MNNIKLILLTAVIPCLYSGCAAVPKAKFSNVEGLTVAKILWQLGNPQTETTISNLMAPAIDQVFSEGSGERNSTTSDPNRYVTRKTVWPDPEMILERKNLTIKYDISEAFTSIHCKDTLLLKQQAKDKVVLSVKCEKKYMEFRDFGVLGLLDMALQSLNPVYGRDLERERFLMVSTAKILSEEHHAQVEWLGQWRP